MTLVIRLAGVIPAMLRFQAVIGLLYTFLALIVNESEKALMRRIFHRSTGFNYIVPASLKTVSPQQTENVHWQ